MGQAREKFLGYKFKVESDMAKVKAWVRKDIHKRKIKRIDINGLHAAGWLNKPYIHIGTDPYLCGNSMWELIEIVLEKRELNFIFAEMHFEDESFEKIPFSHLEPTDVLTLSNTIATIFDLLDNEDFKENVSAFVEYE